MAYPEPIPVIRGKAAEELLKKLAHPKKSSPKLTGFYKGAAREYRESAVQSHRLYVDVSKVHGLGLFVGAHTERGTLVVEHSATDDLLVPITSRAIVYAHKHGSHFRCARTSYGTVANVCFNHSCSPSARRVGIRGNVVARRTMNPGEEVTLDYRVDGYLPTSKPCNCGASNCSGIQIPCDGE